MQLSHGELFATARGEQEGLLRLIERLQARLGPTAVTQLEPHDDHSPEHAFREVPIAARARHARPMWIARHRVRCAAV